VRVLILNTCSTLNRGDAAIVLGQIHLVRKYCPSARIAITSKTPVLDRAFYEPMGVEVMAPLTPALSVYKGLKRKLTEGTRELASLEDKRRLIRTLRCSDLVLSCGGGYFYSYRNILPGTTFWQNVIQAYLAASLNKPLIFLPQSFGPFGSSLAQRGIKHLVEGQSVLKVFAREKVSHRLLRRMVSEKHRAKIALCPDMAFYLEDNASQFDPRGTSLDLAGPILAINLREWAFPESEDDTSRRLKRQEYLNALTAVARFFVQRYRGWVVVVPQSLGPDPNEDDRGICAEFYQRARECVPAGRVVQFRETDAISPTGFMHLLSQVAILIGTRLHSCILALLAGVPAISIGYQYKSQGTMDILELGRFNMDINNLSPEGLLGSVEEIMDHRREIQDEIQQSIIRARAWIDEEVGTLIGSLRT